jgi:hypothetical protein
MPLDPSRLQGSRHAPARQDHAMSVSKSFAYHHRHALFHLMRRRAPSNANRTEACVCACRSEIMPSRRNDTVSRRTTSISGVLRPTTTPVLSWCHNSTRVTLTRQAGCRTGDTKMRSRVQGPATRALNDIGMFEMLYAHHDCLLLAWFPPQRCPGHCYTTKFLALASRDSPVCS